MTEDQFNSEYQHVLRIAVAWNDMDALGHVNNTRYFMYMESARVDFLLHYGQLMPLPDENIGPILAFIDCQFIVPITFPDVVIIGSRITEVGNTSVKMDQGIYSTTQEKLVAAGKSVLVLINYKTGEKVKVPEEIRALIKSS